jgi:hypothetical protein
VGWPAPAGDWKVEMLETPSDSAWPKVKPNCCGWSPTCSSATESSPSGGAAKTGDPSIKLADAIRAAADAPTL